MEKRKNNKSTPIIFFTLCFRFTQICKILATKWKCQMGFFKKVGLPWHPCQRGPSHQNTSVTLIRMEIAFVTLAFAVSFNAIRNQCQYQRKFSFWLFSLVCRSCCLSLKFNVYILRVGSRSKLKQLVLIKVVYFCIKVSIKLVWIKNFFLLYDFWGL